MISKKTVKGDLTKFRSLFFHIGLFTTMLVIVLAFEWKTYEDMGLVDLNAVSNDFEELLEIPPTEQPPPPPPKIKQPEIIEIPDEEEIEEEIEIDLDVEITEETVIEEIIIEEAPEEEVADEIFQIVEEPATPVGGYEAFYKYISKNIKYPAQARRMGIEGRVFVQFVVSQDGSITEVQTVRGIGAGCDKEAERLLKNAPKWNPPKQRGQAVRQRVMVRLSFQLN